MEPATEKQLVGSEAVQSLSSALPLFLTLALGTFFFNVPGLKFLFEMKDFAFQSWYWKNRI